MIKYAVKKCDSFGFAPDIEKAKELFSDELDEIVYIDDEHPISDEDTYKNENKVFFVILGKQSVKEEEELKKSDEDLKYLENELKNDKNHTEALTTCIELYKNRSLLDDKSLKADFCEFLVDLYPKLKDSSFKYKIFNILRDEHVQDIEHLINDYPFEFETIKKDVIVHTKPFEDVKIILDKEDNGFSSSIYKNKDDFQKSVLGDSAYLEAVYRGIFTIVKGKRSAGFNYENRLMNHDTLDLLARNGILFTPEYMDKGSFGRLMKVFSACKSFSVIFIHPSLLSKPIKVEYPSEPALPEYIVKEGEILAIAFRYMCMNFFGYKGVYDESLKEYEYLF